MILTFTWIVFVCFLFNIKIFSGCFVCSKKLNNSNCNFHQKELYCKIDYQKLQKNNSNFASKKTDNFANKSFVEEKEEKKIKNKQNCERKNEENSTKDEKLSEYSNLPSKVVKKAENFDESTTGTIKLVSVLPTEEKVCGTTEEEGYISKKIEEIEISINQDQDNLSDSLETSSDISTSLNLNLNDPFEINKSKSLKAIPSPRRKAMVRFSFPSKKIEIKHPNLSRTQIENLEVDNPEEKSDELTIEQLFEHNFLRKDFKKYSKKCFVLDQFNYFVRYQDFIKNESTEIGKEIYEDFTDLNGNSLISISHRLRKKVETLYKENEIKSSLTLVYKEVYKSLEDIYQEFKSNFDYQYTLRGESWQNKPSKAPSNFEELKKIESCFELFQSFIFEHFGWKYVSCYNLLQNYQDMNSSELRNQVESFVNPLSKNCCIFNSDIRNSIFFNGQLEKEWYQNLQSFLETIFKNEYYPRFINSKMWKDFSSYNFKKNENKFDKFYEIKTILKKSDSFSQKIEYCIAENRLTKELFSVKKLICTKKMSEEESKKFFNQLQHEHIIQLIELFNEDLDDQHSGMCCLIIVTNFVQKNLNSFFNCLDEHLTEKEIIKYMIQISKAVHHFHQKSIHFEIGNLREDNIYLSNFDTSIFVDEGFYYDENEIYSTYFDPPEDEASKKSDIYALGFILFRFMTLESSEEIEKYPVVEKKNFKMKTIFKSQNNDVDSNLKDKLMKFKVRINQ